MNHSPASSLLLFAWVVVFAAQSVIRPTFAVMGGSNEYQLMDVIKKNHPDFVPRSIVDVGANKGDWTKGVKNVFPSSNFFMLEASPDKDGILQKVVAETFPNNGLNKAGYSIAVMSARANDTVEFFQGGDTGNSMFRENTIHYENQEPVIRTTSTLDLEVKASFMDIDTVDILKIDVQGAEVMVLRGGSKVLQAATFVQLESGLVEYNAGGCCLFELDEILRDNGFYLYEFGEMWRHPNAFKSPGVGQFDMLYVKPSSPRLPQSLQAAKFCGAARHNATTTKQAMDNDAKHSKQSNDDFLDHAFSPELFFAYGVVFAVAVQTLVQTFQQRTSRNMIYRPSSKEHAPPPSQSVQLSLQLKVLAIVTLVACLLTLSQLQLSARLPISIYDSFPQ